MTQEFKQELVKWMEQDLAARYSSDEVNFDTVLAFNSGRRFALVAVLTMLENGTVKEPDLSESIYAKVFSEMDQLKKSKVNNDSRI